MESRSNYYVIKFRQNRTIFDEVSMAVIFINRRHCRFFILKQTFQVLYYLVKFGNDPTSIVFSIVHDKHTVELKNCIVIPNLG